MLTKRDLLAGIVGGGLGVVAGGGGMLIAFPYLFPPPPSSDAVPVDATGNPLASRARFVFDEMAPGRDIVHWANGDGQVMGDGARFVIRLGETFEAGPGPNYWLYLNTGPVGDEAAFNADEGRLRLAPLRSFEGAQNYELALGMDPLRFHTLTIWCESFGVYIGSAAFVPV